ncbi:cell wall-binding repeat-containing protein [Acidimicrobiia bacterium EGI L10123]|uniref:cell wall-binding repeat-containing protein n=1 Tax=Salinilacustrithrix flava TaxID=2957203 RepID=UPI003D7C26FA|nr:cell wall-binding repeat-containing protein [Acidimicrobiia bacterium EGI L10123]
MASTRRPVLTCLLAVVALLMMGLTGSAGAETPDPSPWPNAAGNDPGIDATAHSIRIAGLDRTQTSLSAALLLRGAGGYPFTTADRTSGDADLANAEQWWGLGTCPFAVIITAGDTAADSLAAASLSDPTDLSTEPLLERTAARNPAFDQIGEVARVDTDSAPIVVTASARQGATELSLAARQAVADLAGGGCDTVDAAIIVGGSSAVPTGVEQQVLGLGVDQVFRVAGTDRFGTAAAIAGALGTGESPTDLGCDDDVVTDGSARMGFHGNAAVELRSGPTECEVLGRTVVLTDGITGADALAAGWWTSTWQVPVLLVDGSGRLPTATRDALNSLVIDNVVVLGGSARVPDQTLAEVRGITGAETHRVAGTDRYATSVAMAETFGGWFGTGDGSDHDASMVCVAASSGSGAASVGWPDALGAGPWCAAAGGLATATPAPARGLPPVSGPNPRVTRGGTPSHDAVPVLLTPVASPDLADPVADLLANTFDPAQAWCSSVQASDACLDPGFVVAFGGTAVLAETALRQAARAVSGETYVVFDDQAPSVGDTFWTELDLTPVHAQAGAPAEETIGQVCTDRGALDGVRWLAVYADALATVFGAEHDVFANGRYVADRDGVARSPGESAPACVRVPDMPGDLVNALGVSLSGNVADAGTFDIVEEGRFELSAPISQRMADDFEGTDTGIDGDDGTLTRISFADDGLDGIVAVSRTEPTSVTGATVDLRIRRGTSATDPDTFDGALSLSTGLGSVLATVSGEALFVDGVWRLRGRTTFTGGTWNATEGAGGFRADLTANQTDPTDDEIRWQIDGLLAPIAT